METNECWNTTFQILNAVGSLATFGAFIFLFIKDKNKQDQIDRLAIIGDNIKEQNQLLDEQVCILRSSLGTLKLDDNSSKRLVEIENQKLLLQYKPRFIFEGANIDLVNGNIKVRIKNKGNIAKILEIVSDQDIIDSSERIEGKIVEKGDTFYVPFKIKGGLKYTDDYGATLNYEDQLGNKYRIKIIGKGQKINLKE